MWTSTKLRLSFIIYHVTPSLQLFAKSLAFLSFRSEHDAVGHNARPDENFRMSTLGQSVEGALTRRIGLRDHGRLYWRMVTKGILPRTILPWGPPKLNG
jgi:hypothetical protein